MALNKCISEGGKAYSRGGLFERGGLIDQKINGSYIYM